MSLGALVANHLYYLVYRIHIFDTRDALVELSPYIVVSVVILFYKLSADILGKTSRIETQLHQRVEVLDANENYPVSEMIVNCEEIDILTLSGSIIVPLTKEETIRSIVDQRRRSELTILISDPFSQSIIERYQKDEPLTSQASIANIEKRIILLSQIISQLRADERKRVHVGVYRNYPTVSVFRGDNKIYFSYYGYKLRGEDTPTVLTASDQRLGIKILEHFKSVREDATPIALWIERNYESLQNKEEIAFCEIYSGIFLLTPDKKFIFQRRDTKRGVTNPGMLSVFGGTVVEGESPLSAAQRELVEETKLNVKKTKIKLIKTMAFSVNDYECMLDHYFVVFNVDPGALTVKEGAGIEVLEKEEAIDRDDVTRGPKILLESGYFD